VTIRLDHHERHPPYYNVAMPSDAIQMIRESLEWTTPVSMVPKVQALFPKVTAKQIHAAWTSMSEAIWKRDANQLVSAEMLLQEWTDDVEIFKIDVIDGVEQLCWGMRKILFQLKGKIVEIAVDATCECPASSMLSRNNFSGRRQHQLKKSRAL
jgi:hypothetical protein